MFLPCIDDHCRETPLHAISVAVVRSLCCPGGYGCLQLLIEDYGLHSKLGFYRLPFLFNPGIDLLLSVHQDDLRPGDFETVYQGVAGQVKVDQCWSTTYCPKPQPRKDKLRRILQVKRHQIPRPDPQLEEVCSILTCPCMHFFPCVIPLSRPNSEGIRVVVDGFFMEVKARCAVLFCCIEISVLAKSSD